MILEKKRPGVIHTDSAVGLSLLLHDDASVQW